MKNLVINPNTNKEMSKTIRAGLKFLQSQEFSIDVITNELGVASIEGHTDEVISTIGMIPLFMANQADKLTDGWAKIYQT